MYIPTSTQGAFLAAGTGISKVLVEGGVCVCVLFRFPPLTRASSSNQAGQVNQSLLPSPKVTFSCLGTPDTAAASRVEPVKTMANNIILARALSYVGEQLPSPVSAVHYGRMAAGLATSSHQNQKVPYVCYHLDQGGFWRRAGSSARCVWGGFGGCVLRSEKKHSDIGEKLPSRCQQRFAFYKHQSR